MPRQPNNQERKEKPETESYRQAKPINDRLAAILLAVGGICSLVATWGGIDNHHTTLIVSIIIGILSFVGAGYLHWTPQERIGKRTSELINQLATLLLPNVSATSVEPKLIEADVEARPIPFEAEHDRLAKEVVRLRIQNERLLEQKGHNEYETTKLEHQDSVDETIKIAPEKRPSPKDEALDLNAVVYPPHFFHSGYGDLWTEYTEDVFDNIIWRWQYNAHIDNTPRNLHAYCIECQQLMKKTQPFHGTSLGPGYFVQVTCRRHAFYHVATNSFGDFMDIKERIQKKLHDGSWVEVVDRQRMARGQATIGGPIQSPLILNPLRTHILIAIGELGGSCLIDEVIEWFELHVATPLHRVSFDRHLNNLQQEGYIRLHDSPADFPPRCSLTQKGREYVDDNHLLDQAEISK